MAEPLQDTIVACASAPGRSDRALVRASGPGVPELARRLLEPCPERPGMALCRVIFGTGRCPAVVLMGRGPRTYTGEDALEVLLPGNPYLVERFIEACCAVPGVRRAGPGEFTARAYFNGKLTLEQAEGVAALIAARSSDDLDAARRLASGRTGQLYERWAAELTALLALVEAGIDFVDQEDVVPIAPAELRRRLDALAAELREHARTVPAAAAEDAPPLVALIGPPNAGKSTLFNALLGRARSVVADQAGVTRDVIVETLRLDEAAGPGLAVRLADLPGLDAAASSPAERAAQEGAMEAIRLADALVQCDPMGRFPPVEPHVEAPVVRVRTKADLAAAAGDDERGGEGGEVAVCALDGWRLDVLRRAIADAALRPAGGSASAAMVRHARQIGLAVDALEPVIEAIEPAAPSLAAPELVADGLRAALDAIEQVVGRVTPDDVIGRVFATFCVGK